MKIKWHLFLVVGIMAGAAACSMLIIEGNENIKVVHKKSVITVETIPADPDQVNQDPAAGHTRKPQNKRR